MPPVQTGFDQLVTSLEELEAIIGLPSKLVKNKLLPALDEHCRDFIARSPFALVGTANAAGQCDVSPRGDAPGFALVLDDTRLVLPERAGNRLADTMRNILVNPQIGLLFLIPGISHTVRVNGRACILRDKAILEQMTMKGKVPLVGIGVEVEQAFAHCPKAFKRSHLWETETWAEVSSVKTLGQMLECIAGIPAAQLDRNIEEGNRTRLY